MIAPSSNPVTLLFGAYGQAGYTQTSPHKGLDFGWKANDGSTNLAIVMPCDAVITQKPNNGADGNGTYFYSPDGRYYMGLLHAKEYTVADGATVKQGQQVAIMGQTGTATGVHCHFAVIDTKKASDPILGKYIDPLTLLSGGSGGDTMNAEQVANLRKARLDQIAGLFNIPDGDNQAAIIENITNMINITHLRSDRLNEIASYLGVQSGDDQAAILKALRKLQQGTADPSYETVTETLYRKK